MVRDTPGMRGGLAWCVWRCVLFFLVTPKERRSEARLASSGTGSQVLELLSEPRTKWVVNFPRDAVGFQFVPQGMGCLLIGWSVVVTGKY